MCFRLPLEMFILKLDWSGYCYAPSKFLKQVELDVLFIDTSQIA